jgi:hypothetical protein
LQKYQLKNPKPIFVRFFKILGVSSFSVRGVQKHDKKIRGKSDQPWCFFGRRGTNQPRQGPSCFFECPLALGVKSPSPLRSECTGGQAPSPPQFVRERPGGQDPPPQFVRDCTGGQGPQFALSLSHTHKTNQKKGEQADAFSEAFFL